MFIDRVENKSLNVYLRRMEETADDDDVFFISEIRNDFVKTKQL